MQADIQHLTMTHRCRHGPGQPLFSVQTGPVREKSKLPCRVRAIGSSLLATNLQGLSSLQRHRELGLKHLHRYGEEFKGRHNLRECDTLRQLGAIVAGRAGQRLDSRTLLAGHGLPSGARD